MITASFGLVACHGCDAVRDVETLYRLADQAMYEAKAHHRNRVVTCSRLKSCE
ncbi:diguanylate cyclase [Halomonas sp. BC04]|uniref:diguanylate cyclase n=1 Tax=Halomonas sp. BC04 TaxID=1403540 RepID=UPI0003ED836F|nr:diguanylate cyclase [Halomonas sp. BC04]EWH03606.1 hypothetical protein Q427_02235 [Halomonas sp. BC04]